MRKFMFIFIFMAAIAAFASGNSNELLPETDTPQYNRLYIMLDGVIITYPATVFGIPLSPLQESEVGCGDDYFYIITHRNGYYRMTFCKDGEIYETEFTDNGEDDTICLGSGSDWRVYLVRDEWEDTI